MMTEREREIVRLADELVRRHALTLPLDVAALCRHFGARLLTLSELEELLASLNLHFGMDITKYKLEKE